MVAYNFQPQFAHLVSSGAKRQTIRPPRVRHAKPGEEVQLYTGMRTPMARLLGRAICDTSMVVKLRFTRDPRMSGLWTPGTGWCVYGPEKDAFARQDGFEDWAGLQAFFTERYGPGDFEGVLIRWGELVCGPAKALRAA